MKKIVIIVIWLSCLFIFQAVLLIYTIDQSEKRITESFTVNIKQLSTELWQTKQDLSNQIAGIE